MTGGLVVSPVALDWHVGYDCGIKHRLSLMQIAPLVHAPGGVTGLLERLRAASAGALRAAGDAEAADADGGGKAAGGGKGGVLGESAALRAGLRRTSPSEAGLVETFIPAAEAQRRADTLRRFRRTCRDCPANAAAGREGFGCFGTLPLPITAAAEEALMVLIVLIMEGGDHVDAAAAAPIRHIWDNGLTGEDVGVLRAQVGFFELEAPVVARVGPFLEKRDISSNQVFEVFMTAATFPLEYAVLFQAFLAEFPRLAVATDAGLAADAVSLVRFFKALLRAQELGVDTHLTPLVPDPRADTSEERALTHESLPALELGLMDGG